MCLNYNFIFLLHIQHLSIYTLLNTDYLLYVSDVHQLDNFILLGGAGSGAGALKAQVTDREREKIAWTEQAG